MAIPFPWLWESIFPFGRECDDTNQPTDVEPDDASPVVSQASAMADAPQSVVIIL